MTPFALIALLALPALCAPLPPGASLEEAEAAIELALGEVIALSRDFEAGATVYAQAPDLAAAAEQRRRSWKQLNDRYYDVKGSLHHYRNELERRELQAAADALNTRVVAAPLLKKLSEHLETATRLELSIKASFKTLKRGFDADAEALRAESHRRAGQGRLRRSAVTVLATLTAGGLLLLLLRRRERVPVPAPVERPRLRRPQGPARLE